MRELEVAETKITAFEKELESLINKYSLENGSNTPDFLLTEYLIGCLKVFNTVTKKRTKWYKPEDTDACLPLKLP